MNPLTISTIRGKRSKLQGRTRSGSGRRARFLLRPAMEFLESRWTPAIVSWTGQGATNLWSETENWSATPQNGDDLVFPSGTLHASNDNDLTGMSFASITISGSGYEITGDALTLSGGITASFTSGAARIQLPINFSAATTINVGASAILTLGGILDGSDTVTKSGAGELDLTADNIYTGTTAVTGGKLVVEGSQPSSLITLASGTTLSGTGTVGGVTTTSATMAPGTTGPGKLTVNGDLTLDSATKYNVALNGGTPGTNYSQLSASGTINLDHANLVPTLGFTPSSGQSFTIIDNTGSSAITGTFIGLAEGATITVSGVSFKISYVGGDGNDVTLTGPVDSSTTISATPTSTDYGDSVALTATVTPSSGSDVPTGTVEFFAGFVSLGTATLTNGVAVLNTTAIPAGTNSIKATYSGNASYKGSTSAPTTVTVAQASTSTALTAAPTSGVFGQSIALTANVTSSGGTPTGTVEFFNGAVSLGTGTLTNGVATLNTSSLNLGTNSITAVYNSANTGNFATSTSTAASVSVTQASTTSNVSISANPAGLNTPVTLTATISATSPGSGKPTGTVEFFDGSTSLGTGTLTNGVATLDTAFTTLGSHSITVQYQGDTNYTTSTSPALAVNVLNSSATSTNVSPSTSTYGNSVALTATVTASSGSGTPTGTVEFFAGTTSLGTATLTNGVATLNTTAIPAGTNSITANYKGDSSFATSTSGAVTATVAQASSSTALTVAPTSGVYSQSIVLTATVSSSGGTPTGTVEFFSGATSLGTATLTNGTATLTSTTIPVGTNSITAVYNSANTGNFATSTSAVTSVPVSQASTTSNVSISTNPAGLNTPVTLTATISATSPASSKPTGTVEFYDGSTLLGTGTLNNGIATLSTTFTTLGSHSITVKYPATTNFATSTSPALAVNVLAASATAITVAPTTSVFGQPVALTATVTASAGGSTPTGTVEFFAGTTSLGTATLDGNGVAVLNTGAIPVGTNSITANYKGDSTFAPSTSSAVTSTVSQASTSGTLTSSATSATYGTLVTFTATVTANSPSAGVPTGSVTFYAGSVAIGTAVLNASGVALLSTSSLAAGSNTVTAQYTGSTQFAAVTFGNITVVTSSVNTSTSLSASPTTGEPGDTITLTSKVSAPSGNPTGTVTFYAGSTVLGTAALSNGTAVLKTTTIPVGANSITAVYSGDSTFVSSISASSIVSIGSNNQIYVSMLYLSLLGRQADDAGLAYWTGLLDNGTSANQVVRGIARSREGVTAAVQGIYQSLLGVTPSQAQVNNALSRRGTSLGSITLDVLGSRDFYQSQGGGTISGFLSALGNAVLGSELPTTTQAYFANQLRQGASTYSIAQQLLSSTMGQNGTINSLYSQYLGRGVDGPGLAYNKSRISQGANQGELIVGLLTSTEYHDLALGALSSDLFDSSIMKPNSNSSSSSSSNSSSS